MKIIEKVAFNIASEASYVFSVTRQVNFNRAKIGVKCQNSNAIFCVIFNQCEWAGHPFLKQIAQCSRLVKTLASSSWKKKRVPEKKAASSRGFQFRAKSETMQLFTLGYLLFPPLRRFLS